MYKVSDNDEDSIVLHDMLLMKVTISVYLVVVPGYRC